MWYKLVVASLMLSWTGKKQNLSNMIKLLDKNGLAWKKRKTELFVDLSDSLQDFEKLTHYKTSSSWDDQISLDIDFEKKLIIIHDDYIE